MKADVMKKRLKRIKRCEKNSKLISTVMYYPCSHEGECNDSCPCIYDRGICEKFCYCRNFCGLKYQGCSCLPGLF